MARVDVVDRDPKQPPPSKPDAEHTSFLDFEAGRRPVVEELVGRDWQRYANDSHKLRSLGATTFARPLALFVVFLVLTAEGRIHC